MTVKGMHGLKKVENHCSKLNTAFHLKFVSGVIFKNALMPGILTKI